jgi:hypothetical protein
MQNSIVMHRLRRKMLRSAGTARAEQCQHPRQTDHERPTNDPSPHSARRLRQPPTAPGNTEFRDFPAAHPHILSQADPLGNGYRSQIRVKNHTTATVSLMPTHEVKFDLPTGIVLHSDVKFVVWSDAEKLGELQVSQGTIDWIPGNARTRYQMEWEKFDEMMVRDGAAGPR